MITLLDIQASVSNMLHSKFGYLNYVEAVKKNIKRPSFFINVMPLQTTNFVEYKNKLVNIDIMYFSKQLTLEGNTKVEEDMGITDSLENLFGTVLSVGNLFITILNTNFKTVNDILHCSFTLDFTDYVEYISVPLADGRNENMATPELDPILGYTKDNISTMKELIMNESEE